MICCRDPRWTVVGASTALLYTVVAWALVGCVDERGAADAYRTLGTQLGSAPRAPGPVVAGAGARQAASADDLTTARRYLEATLRLDPTNDAARAALAGLGGVPDDALAPFGREPLVGPVASRVRNGRSAAGVTRVAFGEVGALRADLAAALAPWTVVPNVTLPIARSVTDGAGSLHAVVASASSDVAGFDAAPQRARLRPRAVVQRHAERDAGTPLRDPSDGMGVRVVSAHADSAGDATSPRKHKHTWPWTRAQRWLVAKGIGGGAGAGVVVGAIVGNLPGAIIAGSLGGGALGFKKATKIGPAAPFPSPRDSATFAESKRARDAEAHARSDPTTRVAASPP